MKSAVRHVAVAVLRVPGAEDPEEGRRRRPRCAAPGASSRRGRRPASLNSSAGSRQRRRRRGPERGVRGLRVELLEGRLGARRRRGARRRSTATRWRSPRSARCPARGKRHRVAEPLVRDLVDDRGGRGDPAVVGLGLALERVADLGRPVDDAASRAERIRRRRDRREERDDLRLRPRDARRRDRDSAVGPGRRVRRVDGVVDRHAVGAGCRRSRSGRRRWWRWPGRAPSGRVSRQSQVFLPSALAGAGEQVAVGHHRLALGHGDHEVVGRLVARACRSPRTSRASPAAR